MLKGCRRELIVMQTRGSALFESAFFVLRQTETPRGEGDMLAEAERLVGVSSARVRRKKRLSSLRHFLLGALCGGAAVFVYLIHFL